jgi:hypothetical protein
MKFSEHYFVEEQNLIYSGQKGSSPEFNYDKLGQGNDKEGVGFYFTSDKQDASSYAFPNGIIITAKNNLKNFIDEKKLSAKDKRNALTMIKKSPVLKDVLTDFGFDPPYVSMIQAMNDLIDSMIKEDDAKDTFLSIWYDMYYRGNHNGLFVKNMASLGYDGIIINHPDNIIHYVIYKPESLEIVNVEKYKKDHE